ncbi:MAG: hypothetical protein HQL31_09730 [Planctomycetes bacterium]|nr:hypothetical protein [Planctomycetota bacterium]
MENIAREMPLKEGLRSSVRLARKLFFPMVLILGLGIFFAYVVCPLDCQLRESQRMEARDMKALARAESDYRKFEEALALVSERNPHVMEGLLRKEFRLHKASGIRANDPHSR